MTTLVPDAAEAARPAAPARRWFRSLRVARVVPETAEAASFVLDTSRDGTSEDGTSGTGAAAFRYRSGQFVTLRVTVDGVAHQRSYSMSSAPGVDPELQITVKRVPGGVVSNWLLDNVRAGDELDVSPPSGSFVLDDAGTEVVAFAAGSGITPVFSILKTAVRTTARPVRLLYANRDLDAAIFRAPLDALAADHPTRVQVEHHQDLELGFVTPERVAAFVAEAQRGAEYFVCGPGGFMHVVEDALRGLGIDDRVHVERFAPDEAPSAVGPARAGEVAGSAAAGEATDPATGTATAAELTISCNGRTATVTHRPDTTILQSARAAGLRPPSSCETGSCATCMAMVVEGRVEMRHNEVLTDDEVAGGWVVTCQAVPTSPTVHVVYE